MHSLTQLAAEWMTQTAPADTVTVPSVMQAHCRKYLQQHDRLLDLPIMVALFTFDTLTQHKARTAIMILQRAVNAKADGVIGPQTIDASRSQYQMTTIRRMALYRLDLIDVMARSDSRQSQHLEANRTRVLDLFEFLITHRGLGEFADSRETYTTAGATTA